MLAERSAIANKHTARQGLHYEQSLVNYNHPLGLSFCFEVVEAYCNSIGLVQTRHSCLFQSTRFAGVCNSLESEG
jgi:hypothetical protein